jgi:AsmA-like C-terminal region
VFRTTLRWLEEAAPGVLPSVLTASLPPGVLQRASLSSHVLVGGGEISLRQLDGSLDDAPIAGSISIKRGEPPAITADLTLDQLSLDPWLPTQMPGPKELARLASGFDTELHLGIRKASLAGAIVQGISIDAGMEAGSLALRRLEATVSGVKLAASGVLGGNGRMTDGVLRLETQDAMPMAALVPAAWRATPALWYGPARLDVQAAGPPDALALGVRLSMADARLDANPTIDMRKGEWSGTVTLRHPGARRFVSTLGLPEQLHLPGLLAALGDGSFSLVTHLMGDADRLAAESFVLTAAALRADGKLDLDRRAGEPHVTGRISIAALPLPIPNGNSEVPLPIGALHGWQGEMMVDVGSFVAASNPVLRDASAAVTVAHDTLRIERFSARLGGGVLSGSGEFDGAANPPALTLQARLADAAIAGPLTGAPLDLSSGSVAGSAGLSANGYSPGTILATLSGHVAVTVTDGALSGFDLYRVKLAAEKSELTAARSAAIDALGVGETGFDRLDIAARLAHGDLSLETARLHGSAGDADLTGGMHLATQGINLRIALRPALPHPPEIALRLSGPFGHPDRTPELANLARFLAERAH